MGRTEPEYISLCKRQIEQKFSFGKYKLGEIRRKGVDNDLSALGCALYDWHELQLRVRDRNAEIHLDGKMVYSEKYQQDFGRVVALIYLFDGTGSIDFARLEDGESKVVFEEGFDSANK